MEQTPQETKTLLVLELNGPVMSKQKLNGRCTSGNDNKKPGR